MYRFWESAGFFTPEIDPARQPFTIIMPPPNVSGDLHLGSVLFVTLEDMLTRWHRMRGEPTLWLPGEDHAAIATQNVVERELAQEGLSRHDIGREAFAKRAREWMEQYRGKIRDQLKRLGASCDWTRECFTLDPGPAKAVRTTFVNLYNEGLIYRGERIINWCPRCQTAISDLEVEYHEAQDHLWYVRYPLLDDAGKPSGDYITIATTRPETIVADVAVAVNPNDERYKGIVGRTALLPVMERKIPVIADEAVDPAFGTGALKITPGHDPVDFEVGQRHNLETISAINLDATMSDAAGPYKGMDRFDCRAAIEADLEKGGYLVKVEPYTHSVGHCQRCHTLVEPLISKQWFLRMEPLAKPAIDVVTERAHPLRAGALHQGLPELDGEHPRLVHLPPALAGPPDTRLVLPRLRRPDRHRAATPTSASTAAPGASSATLTCSTRGSRPPSGRTPPSAGRTTPRTCATSTRRPSWRPATTSSSSGSPA